MRFVTETRLKRLEELIGSIPEPTDKSHALHLVNSIRSDIEDNYAEIKKPISLSGINRRALARQQESGHSKGSGQA